MTYVMGNARALPRVYGEASLNGEHLRLRKINGTEADLLVEQIVENPSEHDFGSEVVITVWFGDVMADLILGVDTRVEWERLS